MYRPKFHINTWGQRPIDQVHGLLFKLDLFSIFSRKMCLNLIITIPMERTSGFGISLATNCAPNYWALCYWQEEQFLTPAVSVKLSQNGPHLVNSKEWPRVILPPSTSVPCWESLRDLYQMPWYCVCHMYTCVHGGRFFQSWFSQF